LAFDKNPLQKSIRELIQYRYNRNYAIYRVLQTSNVSEPSLISTANHGLSTEQAANRLLVDGPNVLAGSQRRTWLNIVRETLREPMFLLLFAAASLYLILGDIQEGLALFGFVLATIGLTLYQEIKTENAIEALRDLTSPRALVIRDGIQQRIAGAGVVVGDMLILKEGDRIPADAVLLSMNDLQVDESLLTGEAIPVHKVSIAPDSVTENLAVARPGSDTNHTFVYSGTLVIQGQGTAQVIGTGSRSEIGRIGLALQTLETERSPLQKQTAQLVQSLAWVAIALSLLLVVVFGLLHGNWIQALLAGIALAMSMLPQEYPVILTVFPALGAWRLSKEKILTRRIAAIETLGATSVLCVDKTGTLTENRMTVTRLYSAGRTCSVDYAWPVDATEQPVLPEDFHTLVEFAILASETDPFDPMEQAFHRLGQHFLANTEHMHRDWTLAHEYSLTPELRAMSHVWKSTDGTEYVVAAKGAPEAIIDLCHLDEKMKMQITAHINTMAAEGLRVLAVAQARFAGATWPTSEHDFEFGFVGLLGLDDPLRPEIPAAVKQCREAGIRIIMITGDYPATAHTIAAKAGLNTDDLLTGDELAMLDDKALQARIKTVSICARITPEQKLRIVQALKADGEIVAMTGDGVNDAPALKAAHVGIAMGGRGTDVARESASLVLLDDNFASIVRAITLGRRIFDNLQKSMSYILAVHVPIAGMALLSILAGLPAMLLPMHIAFLELIIDPACSVAFENEPAEASIMQRPPRKTNAKLFGGTVLLFAILQGIGVLMVVLGAYAWGIHNLSENAARTFAFSILVIANLMLIFFNRSRERYLIHSLRTLNVTFVIVAVVTLLFLALVIYSPYLASVFRFVPLSISQLAAALGLGIFSVSWIQIVRMLIR
jgi:Ca2+-transporting ATPase